MAEGQELPPDILEQILVGLDVKNLIRFKGVCKSWYSLISGSRFINAHLLRSYNDDRNNTQFGHRRILMLDDKYLIGSCNGLVCIYSYWDKLFVTNPLTKATVKLKDPRKGWDEMNCNSFCFGFGYDSSTDDYKVVFGFKIDIDTTFFQILSLKSNVWNYYGEVKYTFCTESAVLCNGALHWYMKDPKNKKVILSFDLSKEEFKEIAEPDDPRYPWNYDSRLGVMEDCLCIFQGYEPVQTWIMKSYNVKQSWQLLPSIDLMQHDIAHNMKHLKAYNRRVKSVFHDDIIGKYFQAPLFVQSLVSPPVAAVRPKRKRQVKNGKNSDKMIKGATSGSSAQGC